MVTLLGNVVHTLEQLRCVVEERVGEAPDAQAVFWTGGVDSTCYVVRRLLQGASVLPVYIAAAIDARRNRARELAAIGTLGKCLATVTPKLEGVLLPSVIVGQCGRPLDASFSPSLELSELLSGVRFGGTHRHDLGAQYLPLMSIAHGLRDITGPVALCAEFDGRFAHFLSGPSAFTLDTLARTNVTAPLLYDTKAGIVTEVCSAGSALGVDLLGMTWTCWTPTLTGGPCGACAMCRQRGVVLGTEVKP